MSDLALTRSETNAVSPIEDELAVVDGLLKMAGHLVESKLLPNGVTTAPAALAIMLTGREFGWGAMKSFRMIDVIHGRPSIKSDGLMGIVGEWCMRVGDGAYIKVIESTSESCTVEYRRPGWDGSQALTYTWQDAERAGLVKSNPNYGKYPRDMLRARAQSTACRMGFADVVGGFYDPEELGAIAKVEMPAPSAQVSEPRQIRQDRKPERVEAEVVDAEYTDVPQQQAIEAPRDDLKLAKQELWRMANGSWGLDRDGLDAIAVSLTSKHLEDLDHAGITGLYRRLVSMSPDEREATVAAANEAA